MPAVVPAPIAVAALAGRVGSHALADRAVRETWAIAGVVPDLVVRPADRAEVAATVAAVAASGAALVPLGRGAHRGLGHPPARYDLALVTERLSHVRDYTPADMTVTVEAGTTVADLDALLAREGQWLPVEPPLPGTTTVGGLLAADLAGPLAASQGRVRDFVIGVEVVTAAGVVARAGGRVVKNVAGYDLMKLVIGSLGTLAVLTEVTFKVRPRPEVQRGLVFVVRGLAPALRCAAAFAAAGVGALAVVVRGEVAADEREVRILVRLGGVAADVAVGVERLAAVARHEDAACELDADAWDARVVAWLDDARDFAACAAGDLVVRLATLPSRLPALARAVTAAVGDAGGTWQADPLRGILLVALATTHAASLLAGCARAADQHGAHLVVERRPDALATSIAVWHPLPAGFALMQRVKRALDPDGVFAAGRFVGGL